MQQHFSNGSTVAWFHLLQHSHNKAIFIYLGLFASALQQKQDLLLGWIAAIPVLFSYSMHKLGDGNCCQYFLRHQSGISMVFNGL